MTGVASGVPDPWAIRPRPSKESRVFLKPKPILLSHAFLTIERGVDVAHLRGSYAILASKTLSDSYLIVSDPDICGGKPVARGTRVPVHYILELWTMGYNAEKIHEQYPTVPVDLISEIVRALSENKILKVAG